MSAEVEKHLCAKIHTAKKAWSAYEILTNTCRESGITFLDNHINDTFNSHMKELGGFRQALCQERGE